MEYKVTIKGFEFNLNNLIAGRIYNYRTKKYHNPVKQKGDMACIKAIRRDLKGIQIDKQIDIHYHFYCKDKRMDKMNIFSACDKSFQDALQTCKVIKNDGWSEIGNITHDFYIDKENPRVEIIIIEKE